MLFCFQLEVLIVTEARREWQVQRERIQGCNLIFTQRLTTLKLSLVHSCVHRASHWLNVEKYYDIQLHFPLDNYLYIN